MRLSERRKGGKMQSTVPPPPPPPLSKHEPTQSATTATQQDEAVDVEADAELDETLCNDSEWVARDSSGVVHVLWSMHSAMSECLHFIQLLQPRFIVPINPPAALTSLACHGSDDEAIDSAVETAGGGGGALLGRKRRSSSLVSSMSLAERDRLVVTSLQRYIDSLLPHKRIVVRSPITAAEAEAMADGEAVESSRLAADMVPDTPPRLQGVKRMHSSPCKLQSISEVAAMAKAEVKVEAAVGTAVVVSKAETKLESGVGVSRALFGSMGGGGGSVAVARARSSLLVVREEMDRSLVWQGAVAVAAASVAGVVLRSTKDEKRLDDDMPSLTRD